MTDRVSIEAAQAIRERLRNLISKVLFIPIESIPDEASFVSLGGDSFKALHLYQKCADEGLGVRFQDILHKSLVELSSLTESSLSKESDGTSSRCKVNGAEKLSLMPFNYNFDKIYDELRGKYGLGSEDIETVYPCSPMQESMYIGRKMGSKRLYRTRGLFEVKALDLSHFEAAWNNVVRRHQTLRTVYVETSDPSSGRLLDAVVLKTTVEKVMATQVDDIEDVKRRFTAGDHEEESLGMEESQHRVTIYRTTRETRHTQTMFEADLSHLTVDGSSFMIIINELARSLQGSPLAGLAPGYSQYIDYLQNQVDEDGALDYWIEYLDGAEPFLFPVMNENHAGAGGTFQVVDMLLDTNFSDLGIFCRNQNVTISNVLQAVWATVLYMYTDDPDVCFGYLSSGRSIPIPGVSEIVGPMMNLLVCRVNGIANISLGGLLATIRDDFVNSLPHQCFSIGKVQRILGTNETKLFNTIMTSYYSPSTLNNSGDDVFKLVASHNATDFDLVLKVIYTDLDIRARIAYSTAILSAAMAKNVSQSFSCILRRLIDMENPDIPIHQVISISPWDMNQVTAWNHRNKPPAAQAVPIHQLIEIQSQLRPDAPAIYAWDGEMTYRELNEAATVVGHQIVSLGIGTGAFVALFFEKSKWYSVALLGVLKSGHPFVPIEISNPAARREEILQQLGISERSGLIICSRDQAASLKSFARHLLAIDGENLVAVASADGIHPLPIVSLTDPAYVIFTSGSTGTPKGVVVEHGAYAYATQAHSTGIHIDANSRVLQFASYGFDTSMEDHLTTFAVGACLCVASEEDRLSLPNLASFSSKSGANWVHLTPSFAELLTPALMPTIKTLVLGGEAMSATNVRNWASSSQTELIQVYGPSECCVTSTITPTMSFNSDPTNIGQAVPGCRTWVVRPNEPNNLQAIGAVGELLMEGPILAKGYLNKPEETDNSFVQGLNWAPNKRLYRTGDLVKYDSSGQVHFVGRRDGQVKLRGMRIELGEIERQLSLDSRVQHCLALVPKSGPCSKRLTTVVMLSEKFTNTTSGDPAINSSIEVLSTPWFEHISCMRDNLVDKLPPYMCPELWVLLRSIPRNSSGKLDRKKVAKYLDSMTAEDFADILPRMQEKTVARPGTESELSLRQIWSEILNVPEDNIHWNSSFYYLGGDSISAMAVSSMAYQMGLDISAADILRYGSIERLVRASTLSAQQTLGQPTAEDNPTATDLFALSPIQQLHFQASAKGDIFDQQTMVVQVTKKVSQNKLLKAIQSLLQAHPMLRARFECHNGEWMQRVHLDSATAEMNDRRVRFHNRDELEYVFECIGEAKTSINLIKGPLVAIDIFETIETTLMCMTIHHLVIDTVSWRIIFRELEELLLSEKSVRQETTSFKTWCSAQVEFASKMQVQDILPTDANVFATDLGFWGMNGTSNCFKDAISHTITFDAGFTQSIFSGNVIPSVKILETMVFSVFNSFMGIFGRPPCVFTEGHGREPFSSNVNPSNTVGWFTSFSPVVVQNHEDVPRSFHEFCKMTSLSNSSYFASRFLTSAGAEKFKDKHFPMEITLNYLGAFQQFEKKDSLFKRCNEDFQKRLSELRRRQRAESPRYALISVLALSKNNRLSFEVEWNKKMDHQQQLAEWLLQLEHTLNHTISELLDPSAHLPMTPVNALPLSICLGPKDFDHALNLAMSRFNLRLGEIEAIYPCSPIQNGLMLSQLQSPTNFYRQHFLFKLSGKEHIDPYRLLLSWKKIVAAQPILRTMFLENESGIFLQVVLRSVIPDAEILSLEDESDLVALWAQQSQSTGPSLLNGSILHKLRIYTADNGSAYCLLQKNHLITDGTTSRLLIGDFLAAYDGCPKEGVCPYSSYIDYVHKQDDRKISEYWNQYLDGVPACSFSKLSRCQAPASHVTEFTRKTAVISDKTALSAACRSLDLTMPTIFQAAWAVVLSAYLDSEDVVFGVLSHGRNIPLSGASEIIGPMATIVPMRVQFNTFSRMSEILKRVQGDNIEHISRQAISLAQIIHAAKRNGNPIFNSIFNFQKTLKPTESTNIKAELLFSHDTSEYEIAICVTEEQQCFQVSIESPAHFMSEAQAEHLLKVYELAVQTISSRPETLAQELSLVTDMDQLKLQEWNSTRLETNNRCIHDMIAETTHCQPLQQAVCSWDGDLTYADLDSLSTKLATQLQSLGVNPEEIVVLCFEKSAWAVVAMLSVVKSGGAFVHIDPNGAPNRTESVIKQTKSRLGLASTAQHDKLVSFVETIVIVNKLSVEELPSQTECDAPKISVDPSNILYVIFTSGTTGTPKGVVIQHKSFCSAVAYNKSWLQITAESRVLQFTNYCFDASLEEIFTVLVSGGCICIPSETERMSDIPGFVARKQVNWAAFTPSFLRTLDPDDLKSIKFITVHAERMGQDLVAQWAGRIHVRPSYGPTECSVTSTVGAPFNVKTDATNIGWPVGCHGWVVHPRNHNILMPIGAVGELILEGPIVGKGYLNDEAKTAAAFINPPSWTVEFSVTAKTYCPRKCYKTGDLVRYAEDGSLLIKRRKDHSQVKIRGQRVELDDIQYHLNNLSGIIQHSMVLVPESGPLKGRLVAVASLAAISSDFYVGSHSQGITVITTSDICVKSSRKLRSLMSEIDSLLGRELPRYMIPETWLLVRSFPVQLSLKLDRQRVVNWVNDIDDKTLQAALELHHNIDAGEQDCSPTEEIIRNIWAEVLGIRTEQIDLDQSFFRLGGDSIHAMQVRRLCMEAGLQVTTQDVLSTPTVRQLASVASPIAGMQCSISTALQSPGNSSFTSSFAKLILNADRNAEAVIPCSLFQQRMYHAFLKKSHKPYLFNSLVSLSNVNGEREYEISNLRKAWQQTVNRHPMLRSVFVFNASSTELLQKVLREHEADIVVQPVESEADAFTQSRLHLSVIRSRIFKYDAPPESVRIFVAKNGQVFVHFVMGHILIDHVSLAHIFSDFTAFYRNKDKPAIPPPTFYHYIQHIHQTRHVEECNQYWVNKLRGVSPCTILTESNVNAWSDSHSMGSVAFTLEMTLELQEFLREVRVTLSTLLKFTWAMLLHIYIGDKSVCFGYLESDRDIDVPDVDDIVGPLLSIMVARADLSDATLVSDALSAFQADSIRSLRHKTFDLTEVEHQVGCENGLFNTLVNYRKVLYLDESPAVNFRPIWKQDPHEQILVLAFNDRYQKLDATLTYYESLTSEATVRGLVRTYCRVLETLVTGHHHSVGGIKSTLNL